MTDRMKDDLHLVLEREELIVAYQPSYHLLTKKITGAEALIRWQHPKYGTISPEDFVPLAEETGFIIDIDKWVLDKASQDCASWHTAGHHGFTLAINLTALQFENKNFIDYVSKTLNKNNLDPRFLEIEITERLMLTESKLTHSVMNALKEMNIRLAIDDFGTGYASLSNLMNYPIDIVKIDKSFMEHVTTRHKNQVIIQTIIELGHKLGKTVTAEGVETKAQVDFLQEQQCDYIQGEYIAMPVTTDDLMKVL